MLVFWWTFYQRLNILHYKEIPEYWNAALYVRQHCGSMV